MIYLSQLMRPELIALDVEASDKSELLEIMTGMLQSSGLIDESGKKLLTERLEQRENLGSTCLGQGVALPHAPLESLAGPVITFCRLRPNLDFNPPEHTQTHIVLLLTGPREDPELHLQIISKICRMLKDDKFLSDLHSAANPQQVLDAFGDVESRHS